MIKLAEEFRWDHLKVTDILDKDGDYLRTRTSKVRTTFENQFCIQDIQEIEKEAIERGQTEIYSIAVTPISGLVDVYGYLVRTR